MSRTFRRMMFVVVSCSAATLLAPDIADAGHHRRARRGCHSAAPVSTGVCCDTVAAPVCCDVSSVSSYGYPSHSYGYSSPSMAYSASPAAGCGCGGTYYGGNISHQGNVQYGQPSNMNYGTPNNMNYGTPNNMNTNQPPNPNPNPNANPSGSNVPPEPPAPAPQ